MTGDTVRKKIIGVSVVIAVLAILCTQSVTAQPPVPGITLNAWTDKPQYEPGEKGKLKISVLNELDKPVDIYNITLAYPWKVYDADKGEWMGNDTIKGETHILATMGSKGAANDHYYKEVEFTVPSDGRAIMGDTIYIDVWTSEGRIPGSASLSVSAPSWPMLVVGLDTWMTSLMVVVVICTIILAIVVFLATRRTRVPPLPPPKAKAE